jgi:hypothetical protein
MSRTRLQTHMRREQESRFIPSSSPNLPITPGNNNSQNVQARLYLEIAERVGVVEGCYRWRRPARTSAVAAGAVVRRRRLEMAGRARSGWCGYRAYGGAAEAAGAGRAAAAGLGVQRRRGWACSGGGVLVMSGCGGGGGGSYVW